MIYVPYSEQTMQTDEAPYTAPSGRFFLLLLIAGGIVGLVLLLIRAPFWLFYVAPVLMAPLVVWELRSLESADDPPRTKPRRSEVIRELGILSFLDREVAYEYSHASAGLLFFLILAALVIPAAVAGISVAAHSDLLGVIALAILGMALALALWRLMGLRTPGHHKLQERDSALAARGDVQSGGQDRSLDRELDRAEAESRRAEIKLARAQARARKLKVRHERAERDRERRRQIKRPLKGIVKVESDDGDWIVRRGRKTQRFSLKGEALRAAENYLQKRGGGVLVEVDEHGASRRFDVAPPTGSSSSPEGLTGAIFAGGEEQSGAKDRPGPRPRRKPKPR